MQSLDAFEREECAISVQRFDAEISAMQAPFWESLPECVRQALESWETLPEPVRAGFVALAKAVAFDKPADNSGEVQA